MVCWAANPFHLKVLSAASFYYINCNNMTKLTFQPSQVDKLGLKLGILMTSSFVYRDPFDSSPVHQMAMVCL